MKKSAPFRVVEHTPDDQKRFGRRFSVVPTAEALRTPDDFRAYLIGIANEYCRLTGIRLSRLSRQIFPKDREFLIRVSSINFRVDKYCEAIQWIEDNWPGNKPEAAEPEAG